MNAMSSRLALVVPPRVCVMLGLVAMAACSPPAEEPEVPEPAAVVETPTLTVDPLEKPPALLAAPLNRAQMLAAAAVAAEAFASGKAVPPEATLQIGRQFRLRVPFGCSGPMETSPNDVATWTANAERRALRIVARPQVWTESPLMAAVASDATFEAAEGFWIPRPWLTSETCPAAKTTTTLASSFESEDGAASAASPSVTAANPMPLAVRQTVGLVHFFPPGGNRSRQRGERGYEFTQRLEGDAPSGPREYHLQLNGRLTGFPDGQTIRCTSGSPDERPVCLFAVDFTRVAFIDPRDESVLASWDN